MRKEEIKEEDRAKVLLNQNKKQTYQQKKNKKNGKVQREERIQEY